MYEVTIQHPAFRETTFTAKDGGELRNLLYGVARAQGEQPDDNNDLIFEAGAVRSRADIEGVGVIEVHRLTVTVAPAENASDYTCEGHESLFLGLGQTAYCDGRCRPRLRFNRDSLVKLTLALDDEELDESGGCGACGLEADQMCAGCGRCNCDEHSSCERPDTEPAMSGQ
ncbi:hypothetical protein [Actinacidiphila sp. ITFR-21]|uniref:hypothetical protein n=1 Tax=Actinacidiphila sp. ITFR-21 TaxID=3075199 RepID=UPI00288909CC|nr:hypothetical protein [Streptomyces sp. ITFR-21]WNI20374.1 hypothetical protein RLT57_32745 [Streptomyces sp. ITFR-21]